VELDAQSPHDYRRGGLTLSSVNKVHHVHTIARVAEMLGEDEDWLWDVASEMDQEDGLIWVYGPGEESAMASSARSTQSNNTAAHGECLRRRYLGIGQRRLTRTTSPTIPATWGYHRVVRL
jgi:hypothetical protein